MSRRLVRSTGARLRALVAPAGRRGVAWWREWSGRNARDRKRLDGSCAAVLMYHRVLPAELARRLHVEPGMYVTPETFARHLDWLMDSFEVMPLGRIVEAMQVGERLPSRACAISFDDGWLDNAEYAAPALAARRLPATIFVVTDRVGTPGGFWPDELCRRLAGMAVGERRSLLQSVGLGSAGESADGALALLKTMDESVRAGVLDAIRRETRDPAEGRRELLDWEELDRLAEQGFEIESHGASHAILTAVPREVAAGELERSLASLRQRGHARHAMLAYPSGGYDRGVVSLARLAGYRAAFTTEIGLAGGACDPLVWPRLAVHEDISRTKAEFLRFVPGAARTLARGGRA